MNDIESKLLQSLRASNLRDQFPAREYRPESAPRGEYLPCPVVAPERREPHRASVELLYGNLTEAIISAAIQVHRWLGPGQLESTYQRALAKELAFCGIRYRAQVPITSWYRDEPVGEFFADFVVEDKVILELKIVSRNPSGRSRAARLARHVAGVAALTSSTRSVRFRCSILLQGRVARASNRGGHVDSCAWFRVAGHAPSKGTLRIRVTVVPRRPLNRAALAPRE